MKVTRNDALKQITFTFDNDVPALTFDATKAHPSMAAFAEMHGWEQRLRDNAAIGRKQKDGTVITVTEAMRRDAVAELATHYESGAESWNMRAAKAPAQNPIWAQIAAKKGMTYEAYAAERVAADLAELQGL